MVEHSQDLEEITLLLKRYGGLIPRYTSYPTAAQFVPVSENNKIETWIKDLPKGEPLSLYFHVPFCDELCSFCACNTSVVRHQGTREAYADLLLAELERVAKFAGKDHVVTHLHWGGGTPTTIPKEALASVMAKVAEHFKIDAQAELSIELDPRNIPKGCATYLKEIGFNRVSLGVQDIDPSVQQACGRIQSEKQTEDCVQSMRDAGISSINIDLIYGLPRQTTESVIHTAETIAKLKPERLAVFGYAHVPWKQKRQQLIPEDQLPGLLERLKQRQAIDETLRKSGYIAIGLDHYVLPEDTMAKAAAKGKLRRNFQGYTTDNSGVLIGMGASAISEFAQGLSQNAPSASAYKKAMEKDGLPAYRDVARQGEDLLRARIIERLMCDLAVNLDDFDREKSFEEERKQLAPMIADGLVRVDGKHIHVLEKGRPFIRNVAGVFDQYLKALISIVVPAYNEAQNVAKVFDSLCRAWEGREGEWEMILVDDNSPDGTSRIAKKIAQDDSRLRVIRRIGRRGLTSAVIEGILSSSSHFVAVMDGDGQHDETILPRMLDALVDGTDLVVGTRYAKGGDAGGLSGKYREWLSKFGTKVAQKVSGKKCSDPMSGFFAVK
ncbi:coproporphyrinogen iii oxidase, partial [Lasius niger]